MRELTLDDVVIPPQVEKALEERWGPLPLFGVPFEAVRVALLAIAKEPILPTKDEFAGLYKTPPHTSFREDIINAIAEWQRRAFIRREPELPEEVKALHMHASDLRINQAKDNEREVNARIDAAYALGQKNGAGK